MCFQPIRLTVYYWRRNDEKILLVLVAVITFAMNGKAQSNIERLSFGFGCLYQNGLDLTLSYEHEGKYHHMWEFLPTVISMG